LFLGKDNFGGFAWHLASSEGSTEALETLWGWAKEVGLNTHELLLSQTGDGNNAFQLAAWNNHRETLLKLWGWLGETQINPK
jgi:hypothetical protein